MVIFMMHYSQVDIHPIIETSLFSDICIQLRYILKSRSFKMIGLLIINRNSGRNLILDTSRKGESVSAVQAAVTKIQYFQY